MNKNILKLGLSICLFGVMACSQQSDKQASSTFPETKTLSKEVLMDKIKGGWAGQTIGVTYGGPTEFKFNGTMIQDYVKMPWYDGYIKWWYDNLPGLYDDIFVVRSFLY